MLAELKFVQGAVAKKDLLPALTHFRIEGGHVRSYNGKLALSSPINFDIDCTPKAEPFVRAIQNCEETVTLNMTPTGRLSIKSGSFRAYIECVTTETPHVVPEGEHFDIDGEAMLRSLKTLNPFIGDDASRPWSNGVLLKGQSAYATNNVILAEYWVGATFPFTCCIPRDAIREILRIGEAPSAVQADANSISFHYGDGRWVRSNLLDTSWPDIERIIDVECNPSPILKEVFDAVNALKPFTDKLGRIYIENGTISTTIEESEGASFDIPGLDWEGVYQVDMLRLLNGVAKQADFTLYPAPCAFYGDRLRGVILGMRG